MSQDNGSGAQTRSAEERLEPVDLTASPLPGATIGQALSRTLWTRAYQMRGRAGISEFWWWFLVNLVVLTLLSVVIPLLAGAKSGYMSLGPAGSPLFGGFTFAVWGQAGAVIPPVAAISMTVAGLWALVTLVPSITVSVRRLHDTNMSGAWALVALVPYVALFFIFFMMRDPRPEGARFDG